MTGTEVLDAVEDYFNDVSGIDSERVLDIVELYFSIPSYWLRVEIGHSDQK